MKKALKITGIVLLAFVVIVAGLAIWQWKYVSAIIDGIRLDEEQLGQIRVEDTEKTIDTVNQYMESEIRSMTDEEKAKVQSGEMSETEVLAQIIAEATGIELPSKEDIISADAQPPVSSTGPAPQQTAPPTAAAQNPNVSSSDQLVASCVSTLYTLQAQYSAQLAALVGQAKAYYVEQIEKNGAAAAKASSMSMVSGEVAAMENACDAKVEAALGELSDGLAALGADTSIVGELRSAYEKEKSNQRKAYVNRYMK